MVNPNLLPAIKAVIRQNEIGDSSPYCLSFACLGRSGASFGFMQGDMNVSKLARDTLRQVLSAAEVDHNASDRILSALGRPLPNGNPLTKPDTAVVNNALSRPGGQTLVDQMDDALLQAVLNGVDACATAATTNHLSIAALAILYMAPWINMSGPPTLLAAWLKGAAVHGVPPPGPGTVGEPDMQAYLQSMSYFQAHPRNFAHFEQCVQKALPLLPVAEV